MPSPADVFYASSNVRTSRRTSDPHPRPAMTPTRFPIRKFALFLALSACDFLLTYFVITHGDGVVYENNPVAEQALQTGGWAGMAALKAAAVILVLGIAVYVHRRRPHVAQRVLTVACAAVAFAVYTGSSVLLDLAESPAAAADYTTEECYRPGQTWYVPDDADHRFAYDFPSSRSTTQQPFTCGPSERQ